MRAFILGATLALAASGAVAQEIIQYNDSYPSNSTRPEVTAEAASPQGAGMWNIQNEITQFPSASQSASANRDEVRADGLRAYRTSAVNTVYDTRYHY